MARSADPLIAQLQSLYREVDALFAGWTCAEPDECGHCCRFSVTGRQPEMWPIEWRFLLAALRANPPRKASLQTHDCPAYDADSGRCRTYPARPFGCRTHFCAQASRSGKNPRAEIRNLARRLAALAEQDHPSGQLRPLLSWFGAGWHQHRQSTGLG